jgi:CDP-glucose 4,6-dehydratase
MTYLNFFRNKKILITGHNGFKGSWLSAVLSLSNAKILGISLKPINKDVNHFELIKKHVNIQENNFDIRNFYKLKKIIQDFKPDLVFHLAAQALVSKSYADPKYTWETNVIGTLNLLLSLQSINKKCAAVLVTSDKCYKNKEVKTAYKENSELGGIDPYSSSKASAEILIKSFFNSFLKNQSLLRIATARAGNVIGGGDWSDDRLIPDCIKKWSQNQKVIIRNPNSTRPWQHVLDVIHGYLSLAEKLYRNSSLNGDSFNFSSNNIKNFTTIKLVAELSNYWNSASWVIKKSNFFYESNLLQLNSQKAKKILNWHNKLTQKDTIKLTATWYANFYNNKKFVIDITFDQLNYFLKKLK